MKLHGAALLPLILALATAKEKDQYLRNGDRRVLTTVYPAALPYSEIIANPERGFMFGNSYYASRRDVLNAADLTTTRESTGMTVIQRNYYLEENLDQETLSQDLLSDLAADFDTLRASGFKVVLRFAYTNPNNGDIGDSEPPLNLVLSHIAQLAPVLLQAQDVIMVVQAGFVGPWGEWHSSTHFDDDWDSLKQILDAVLDAVPDRIVQIRTPEQKMKIFSTIEFPEPTSGYVTDGSFESSGDWSSYSNGFSVVTDEVNSGSQAIKVTNGGAKQNVYLDATEGSTIELSGYSKSVGTSTGLWDYSIYADVKFSDGTYQWGERAVFTGGTTDGWEHSTHSFTVPAGKTVSRLSLYCLYRNDPLGGTAYFDDVEVKVYGAALSTGGGVLDATTAYSGENIARTGHHNDCFLASDSDYGTYHDVITEYPYLSQETMFTAMGGETCNPNPPRSECPTALEELELFHYTYLNSAYHQDVLASWTDCMDEIKAKLGYRLVLSSGTFAAGTPPGGNLPFTIGIQNEGYASPINTKRVELVLRETSTDAICAATIDTDVRTWYPGSHTLDATAILPSDIPAGNYDLFLNIADTSGSLRTNLDYKIKVANAELNDEETGLIDLKSSLTVGTSQSSPASSGSPISVVCGIADQILPAAPLTNPDSKVQDGSFESDGFWKNYMDGFSVVTNEVHSGTQAIKVNNGGAKQYVYLDAPEGSTIQISGYSKAVGTSTGLWDYSIYADVKFSDGTYEWGQRAVFTGGTTDGWEYATHQYTVPSGKTVSRLSLFCLYRNDPQGGTAYFDDVEVLVT